MSASDKPEPRVVIIGGGPTGVEMAGTLAEIARHTLSGEFRRIDPASARILLLEGGSRLLQSMPPQLNERAREHRRCGRRSAAQRQCATDLQHPLRHLGGRRGGVAARQAARTSHR